MFRLSLKQEQRMDKNKVKAQLEPAVKKESKIIKARKQS